MLEESGVRAKPVIYEVCEINLKDVWECELERS
jgi:hypothetical protein